MFRDNIIIGKNAREKSVEEKKNKTKFKLKQNKKKFYRTHFSIGQFRDKKYRMNECRKVLRIIFHI